MDNQPNNRTDRLNCQWRHLMHITFAFLVAAALFLRFSGGGGYYENLLVSSSSQNEEDRRDLLRVTSRRRTADCNQYHRDPTSCNRIPGCQHNRTACVPKDMMTMQFANKDVTLCSQHNGLGVRCRRNGCAFNRSDRTCSLPTHECQPFNGRVRICNSYDKCIFNHSKGQCELITQTSVAINACTKKRYRACRYDPSCGWHSRQCLLQSSIIGQTATLATQPGQQATQSAVTLATQPVQQATQSAVTLATQPGQQATQSAGGTACWEWHPLMGQSGGDAPTCTNSGNVPQEWITNCPNTNGLIFFRTGQECCEKYFKNAAGCGWKTKEELAQASAVANKCFSWHPSITAPKTCTNDENYPVGWKNGCPSYNGQLFFETYDSCCDNYFKGLPKIECKKVDVNGGQINQSSAGLTTTPTTTKATAAATTKATTAAETTKATTTTTTKATTIATAATPMPSARPSPAPTNKPNPDPTQKPTTKPSPRPTENPTSKPMEEPTKPPTQQPSSPPTPKPTLPPQAVKWYPLSSGSEKTCVQGNDYESNFVSLGWTYKTEDACCKAWSLPCGIKEVKWYPTTSSTGVRQCVQGTDYPWSFVTSGFLYATKQNCCDATKVSCSPPPQKWYPTVTAAGVKACVFGEVAPYEPNQFATKGECCAAFPLACPTTTTTTTTTRPAVTTPPCSPSGAKGCYWWPKLEGTKIKCLYTSNWPQDAQDADVLFGDHDSCYCQFNEC